MAHTIPGGSILVNTWQAGRGPRNVLLAPSDGRYPQNTVELEGEIERLGCAMLGQTPQVEPADKRLYALRRRNPHGKSVPLISASRRLGPGASRPLPSERLWTC
jgi:hypothetical protein